MSEILQDGIVRKLGLLLFVAILVLQISFLTPSFRHIGFPIDDTVPRANSISENSSDQSIGNPIRQELDPNIPIASGFVRNSTSRGS